MRLKMTKNPIIIVGHLICQSAALYGEMQFLLLQEYWKNSARLKNATSAAGDLDTEWEGQQR